jgi:coatomer subunit beta'
MIGGQVWSIDSPISKYTLSGHSGLVSSMEFFTRDGQQYLITGSKDKTAKVCYLNQKYMNARPIYILTFLIMNFLFSNKIWDMQMKECVHTLHHRSEVRCVLPHPTLPVLVTGAEDGLVYLWSSINFR